MHFVLVVTMTASRRNNRWLPLMMALDDLRLFFVAFSAKAKNDEDDVSGHESVKGTLCTGTCNTKSGTKQPFL